MITAHCDACGKEIAADVAAGVRLLLGKRELTFHLCTDHQNELEKLVHDMLQAHDWRVVK